MIGKIIIDFIKSLEVTALKAAISKFLLNHPSFTTGEFENALRTEKGSIARSTVYNILKNLCASGEIVRTKRGQYAASGKKEYYYELSDTAKTISTQIHEAYPLIDFQIWELYQMNEFVNHQMARNTIFVEVENMLDESVFDLLFEKYSHVLHNPILEQYYRYAGEETIIVRKLISEAPSSVGEFKQASLEKILVDLFGRGISGSLISRSQYQAIYKDAFKKYNINQAKMFRYARRRGIERTIMDFIHANTDIILEADK